jgi:hypothetical protein
MYPRLSRLTSIKSQLDSGIVVFNVIVVVIGEHYRL